MTDDIAGLATVSKWNVLWIMACAAIIGFVVLRSTNIVIGEAAFQSTVVVLFAFALWWPLRRERRAWITLAAIVAAHVAVVLALSRINWSASHRANKGDLLFMVADIFLVLIVSDIIEKRTRRCSSNA